MSIQMPATLNSTTMVALVSALESASGVVEIRGASTETFCGGLDIEGVDDAGSGAAVETFGGVLAQLVDGPLPSVALVDGVAQGGGLGIAAACDVVLATPTARFCLPEMLFGLVPGAIWPVLRRRVSEAALSRWAKTAQSFGADEAHRLGLVDELVVAQDAHKRVAFFRRSLARPSQQAQTRFQSMCRRTRTADLVASIREGAAQTATALGQGDVVAARRRFVEGDVPWET